MTLKQHLKRLVLPRLRDRGHLLVRIDRLPDLPWEEHLRALFARYQVDAVVDVGGNFGQFHDTVRQEVGFAGPIVTFEPVPDYWRHLDARRQSDPSWQVEPFALGSTHERAVIHVMESPGLSSLRNPDQGAMRSLLPAPDRTGVTAEETIEVRTLDELVPGHPVLARARRALLKTDTQGFDLEVIRGARGFLEHTVALQMELSVLPIYEDAPHYIDVIREVSALGFDISGMFPVTLDRALRVIEFDCVFVRQSAALAGPDVPPPFSR